MPRHVNKSQTCLRLPLAKFIAPFSHFSGNFSSSHVIKLMALASTFLLVLCRLLVSSTSIPSAGAFVLGALLLLLLLLLIALLFASSELASACVKVVSHVLDDGSLGSPNDCRPPGTAKSAQSGGDTFEK